MTKPVILFRRGVMLEDKEEYKIAKEYFHVEEYRSRIPKDSYVIGRYSTLPYYKELELDLQENNSLLINSYSQHRWIANFEWYEDLKQYTPESWTLYEFTRFGIKDGPFVVKGATNSRKQQWNSLMYAKTWFDVLQIAANLKYDGLLCAQETIVRRYVPLVTYEIGINGLPFTEEYRFFFFRDTLLCGGYYWSIAEIAEQKEQEVIPQKAILKAKEIAQIVMNKCNFFVLDIALTEEGKWILIEINDGQQSGLSTIPTEELYVSLSKVMENHMGRTNDPEYCPYYEWYNGPLCTHLDNEVRPVKDYYCLEALHEKGCPLKRRNENGK